MKQKRVLLAHDNDFILIGLERSLGSHYKIAARLRDLAELKSEAGKVRPDVIVTGLFNRPAESLEHIRQTSESLPDVKVVVLPSPHELRHAREALESGVSALVSNLSPPDQLLAAIDETLAGRTYIEPQLSHAVLSHILGVGERPGGKANELTITPRQREIMKLLAEGLTAKEIADRVGTTKKNVDYHKSRLMKALDVKNSAELVRYALEHDLV
jgi:DNA-binding NarL/FixJ family response regulator